MGDLGGQPTFNDLLQPDAAEDALAFVDPPFNFNAAEVAKWPAEVTGHFLLNCLCRRLGWSSLAGRRLLDFGCGVRFTRTLINLSMDIDFYAGIDANQEVISWLKSEIHDRRFRFEHLDMFNHMYRTNGSSSVDEGVLQSLALGDFDAACMFSVITHQVPNDAELIFKMLHRCVRPGGSLYFTAFIDETVRDYVERDPSNPCHMSTYHPDFLLGLVRSSGWSVERAYPKSSLQQTGFVCRKA